MSQIQIPEGWKISKLKENCEFYVPMRDKPKKFDGHIPWIKIDELNGKYLDGLNAKHRVSDETINSMKLRVYPVGTVLFSCSATIGECAITTAPLTTNQTFIGIHPKKDLFNEYLYYFMKTQKNYLKKIGTHSVLTYISRKKFEDLNIIFPNLETQKKIVQKLDYILDKLDEKKKQILYRMNKFDSKKIHRTYQNHLLKLAFSGVLTGEKPEDSEEKEIQIPVGWESGIFSDLTISFDSLRVPLNASQRSQIKGIYPYYGASGPIDNINDYKYDGKFLLIAEDGENLNSQKKPIAFIAQDKFWVNNHAHVVQTTEKLNMEYLCYYINSLNIMKYAKKQATRPKLKKSDLDKIPIVYPKLSVQEKIAEILDKKFQEWEKYKPKIENIEKQYQNTKKSIENISTSILNSAFSGKLIN